MHPFNEVRCVPGAIITMHFNKQSLFVFLLTTHMCSRVYVRYASSAYDLLRYIMSPIEKLSYQLGDWNWQCQRPRMYIFLCSHYNYVFKTLQVKYEQQCDVYALCDCTNAANSTVSKRRIPGIYLSAN